MKRELFETADGSMSIHLPEIEEQYHSKHGALQEAKHVFINKGFFHFLKLKKSESINILEIGFGTGLNCLLTFFEAKKKNIKIVYTGIEAYPITYEEYNAMNYAKLLGENRSELVYDKLYNADWENHINISETFALKKKQSKFEDIDSIDEFDLIYFDAFGARVQPELWTEKIFYLMHTSLKKEGVLVTYAAKGSVRRAMQAVGFEVERLEGPPGKREMLRATKK